MSAHVGVALGSLYFKIHLVTGTLDVVHLEGWNSIPESYGAEFELRGASWWLRIWFHTRHLSPDFFVPKPLRASVNRAELLCPSGVDVG
jgi:hypothetical protein